MELIFFNPLIGEVCESFNDEIIGPHFWYDEYLFNEDFEPLLIRGPTV
jgi:hypothetical protein